jgi:hypothetical protein
MKTLTKMAVLMALGASTLMTSAQVFTILDPDPFPRRIPDGDANGIVSIGRTSGYGKFEQGFFTQVKLNIQGLDAATLANNGDYYVTLSKIGTDLKAVLINRPGRPENLGAGYGDNGMNITLQDFVPGNSANAAPDIHTYKTIPGYTDFQSPLTGVWAPDGRNADPNQVSAARTDPINQPLKMLSVFGGLTDVNGDWSLLVADMASGGEGRLVDWSVQFTAVPEPHEYALLVGLALIGFACYRRYSLKAA